MSHCSKQDSDPASAQHMNPPLSFGITALALFLTACNRTPPPAPTSSTLLDHDVIAAVGDQVILLSDFRAEMESRSRGRSDAYKLPTERAALLEEMVNSEALLIQAKAAGFDQKPEVVRQIKRFIVSQFLESQLALSNEAPSVSDLEVANRYTQEEDKYAIDERVRFAIIEFRVSPKAAEEKKAEVMARAEGVLNEARKLDHSDRGFGGLAQKYSEDQATRYTRGDAGWVSRGEGSRWSNSIIEAAFRLKQPGELSPVITDANGCYLVRLMERAEAGRRPLEEVKEAIRYQLAQEKRAQLQEAFFDTVKANLKIERNQTLLESVATPSAGSEPKPPGTPAA